MAITPYDKSPKEYAAAYKQLLEKGDKLEHLNQANHVAFDLGIITMAHFQAAAEVLKAEILKR